MADEYISLAQQFHPHEEEHDDAYHVAGEFMSVQEKLKVLEDRGQTDLIEIFKDWKPRKSPRKRKGAPLDQRITLTVSATDKAIMEGELKSIRNTGESISMGGLIRSRAMANLDVQGWRQAAGEALDELNSIVDSQKDLRAKRKAIVADLESLDDDDQEQISLYEKEIYVIDSKLAKLKGQGEKRNIRLQGRMTYNEAETVKWRAERLCLSSADYLRIMIFGLTPNSSADSHLSVDARRRFWISVLDVADNGFGNPPNVYQCSQCETYKMEITRLQARLAQLEQG